MPEGNWTNNVTNSLGNNATNILNFKANIDAITDPAAGCKKTFTATYTCGIGADAPQKSISIAAPADGQIAAFDCTTEAAKCKSISVWIGDDGRLELMNTATGAKIWDSVINGKLPTINPNDPNIIKMPDHAGNGQANPKYDVAAGGGPGRRYPYPNLLPGQFLELGQWIGSPSGTCRLIMGTPDAPNSLQVVTHILGCESLDIPAPAPLTVDLVSTRVYTIPEIFKGHLGKVGYVDNRGQLNLYPDSLTTYNANFENIGSYNMGSGAFLGGSTPVANVDACKKLCTDNDTADTQLCAGFVFDTTAARCQLLDKRTVFAQNRVINANHQYYVRAKNVTGQDISCPSDVTAQTTLFFKSIPTSTSNPTMTASTKCGLANYVESQTNKVAGDIPPLYNDLEYKDADGNPTDMNYQDVIKDVNLNNQNKTSFRYWYDTLQDKYSKLTGNIFDTKTKINTNFSELLNARQNLADWTGEQLQNLTAMNNDRDLNMMSQNYRHIMWSILAIVIIIAMMKMAKSMGSGAPAAAAPTVASK